MTLVLDRAVVGPATHAVVLGVGTYPWLLGGRAGGDAAVAEGMGQLESPPRSAIAMVDWLIGDHADPTAPLATVELLLSQGEMATGYVDPRGIETEVELADKAAIAAALARWKERGNSDDGNSMIFYFCGHGVGRGFELALLARDFGSDAELPYSDAVWFEGLKEGMRNCRATRQVYFVDACRVASGLLLREHTSPLDPVFASRAPFTPGQSRATYYATTTGRPAYGRPGEVSLFTSFLLRGLTGLAANDDSGDWRIETTKLQRVVGELALKLAPADHYGLQSPTAGEQMSFDVHRMEEPPRVPYYLEPTDREEDEEPPVRMGGVRINREGGAPVEWRHPWEPHDECFWEAGRFRSDQPAGERYSWSVTYLDGSVVSSRPRTLNPPYRIVEFPKDGVA